MRNLIDESLRLRSFELVTLVVKKWSELEADDSGLCRMGLTSTDITLNEHYDVVRLDEEKLDTQNIHERVDSCNPIP
jgi:hypothetical protein